MQFGHSFAFALLIEILIYLLEIELSVNLLNLLEKYSLAYIELYRFALQQMPPWSQLFLSARFSFNFGFNTFVGFEF